MNNASKQAPRRWYRRPSRIIPVVFAVALAIGVPVAWASDVFADVPNTNPFHDDISAIKNAGITQGCGGGNFCPTDNITRQAEAAFVHRAAPRVAQSTSVLDSTISPSGGFATDTLVGQVTINVGGVAGGTQFVKVDAHMTNTFNSGTPPFFVAYYIADGACPGIFGAYEIETIASSGSFVTASLSVAKAVPTNTTKTFSLCAYPGGTNVANAGGLVLDATTYPFGSTGGSTLGANSTATPPDRTP